MSDFFSVRRAVTRLFLTTALSLASLSAFAIPIPPPGVPLFTDPQLQACFDELVLVNGWTVTEEVTSLTCPDRNIESLDGLQHFNNLLELDVSGNRIITAYPVDQLPQLEKLDLADNRLFDVFPLRALHNLKQLILSGNTTLQPFDIEMVIQGNPGLTHIGVAGIAMGGLSWLSVIGPQGDINLQELDISDTGAFPDLVPVTRFGNLRVLRAAGNQIVNAWALDALTGLEVLDLSNNNLDGVSPLQGLHNFKQLNLSYNSRLQSFEVHNVIQANPGLTHIGVAGIAMGNLYWLPPRGPLGEYDLQELDISDTGSFPDLTPVTQYTNLRVLKAAGNQIVGTFSLDQLVHLEVLDLSRNRLGDVVSLQWLTNLSQLNLSANSRLHPSDVQNIIQGNPGLTHIGVAGIAMGDLSWLPLRGPQGEYDLQELDINGIGSFDDLMPVAQYINLRVLKAAGNQLFGAWPLDQLLQLEVLDLSDNRLFDAYPLLGLQNLRQLNLSANPRLKATDIRNIVQGNPGLTHIGVAGIAMGDPSWLPWPGPHGEHDLQELDISNTGSFPDLAPVLPYTKLRVLKAAGNQIISAQPLDQLTQLEVLDLGNNQLLNAQPLQMLQGLTQLNLSSNNRLQSFEVRNIIEGNPALTHIGVAGIAMEDLFWLPLPGPQGEFNLQELDISNTGAFPDLAPVTQYPNLRVLKAAGNQLVSTWPAGQMAQLEILDLSDNQLHDVSALQVPEGLKQLYLSSNPRLQASDVQNIIQGSPNLTHIGVAGIPMGDLSWLPWPGPTGEYDLRELDISDTGAFPDLMHVAQYTNLRVLKAAGNQLVSVWPIPQMVQLEVLDLSRNNLVDVQPLQMLQGLTQLNLSFNSRLQPLDVQNAVLWNPGLTHIGVAGIAMGDLNWLPSPGPLGEFDLQALDISNTGAFPDLAPVAQYANLRVLKAAGNQTVSAWPLDQLAQLEVLDLSGNRLGDVVALYPLTKLKQLSLSDNEPVDALSPVIDLTAVNLIIGANPGLTHLGVAGVAIGDLGQLAVFQNPYSSLPYPLVELDISNTGVADLGSLWGMHSLRVLDAGSNNIAGSSGLELLSQLRVLDLSQNNMVEISAVTVLNNLTELNLTGNSQLQAFEIEHVIQSNPGLTHIGVGGIAMGDLGWLPPVGPFGEYNLIELDISAIGVLPDPSLLAQYRDLRVLKASGNAVEKIWWLDQLQRLEVLDLSNNRLSDIWSLTTLSTLREVYLSGNVPPYPLAQGVDLATVNQVIAMNPGITHLGVGGVPIGQLEQLAIFDPVNGIRDNLLELDISDTAITDLIAVAELPRLRSLNASSNLLVDTQPLVQLQDLAVIDLSDNDIRAVITLADIVNLRLLDLRGNNNIQCTELDELEARLAPGVLLRPLNCIVMMPPTVTISLPVAAAIHYSTSSIDFTANASDVEDGNLDGQIQWTSNLIGPIGAGPSFTSTLSAGDHVITAMVTDSHGNTTSASVAVTVLPNTAPGLTINSVQDGALFNEDETVILSALANDPEEGDLSSSIQWSSSLDGVLGSGASVQPPLSVGVHTITASITDATGATTTDAISVTINGLPTLIPQTPPDQSVYQDGESVSFTASASDPEDGDLGAAIQWSSDLDGVLGTGAQLNSVLSVGNHVITASVTDSAGATATQTRTVSVNSPPQLSLLSPADGSLFMLQESVQLTATANDLEDDDISANIQWSSNLDGFLGTGSALKKLLSLGEHTLTASITDSLGGTHAVTTRIVIDQIQLELAVSGNGRKRFATLTWSGSRTSVDIYKDGLQVGTGAADGTATYRFKDQAVFRVCETATDYCSVDVVAQ